MTKSILRYLCQIFGQPEKQGHALVAYGVLVILVLVIVVLPVKEYYQESRATYQQRHQLADWLIQQRPSLMAAAKSHRQSGKQPESNRDQRTLMRLISETAQAQNLKLSRLEQRQTNVTITLDKQPFSKILVWLNYLSEEHQIVIEQVSARYVTANQARATLTLTR